MEEWRPIVGFYGYSVSSEGRVLNTRSGRIMKLSENQMGMPFVGMLKEGKQHKRSVAKLVADAYLLPPKLDTFDSVINLDGDRRNNAYSNLMWRPRWFAQKYHRQFKINKTGHGTPIADMDTGVTYFNPWEAVTKNGLLIRDVMDSIYHNTRTWPTHQRFWKLE